MQTIGLFLRRGSGARGRYLRDKHIFAEVGENVKFQPRLIPLYPKLIKLHNNIMIAAGVRFVTHYASYTVLNKLSIGYFPERVGCIEVMNNVFHRLQCDNPSECQNWRECDYWRGSDGHKRSEPNGVYAGTPAKRIRSFEEYVEKCAELPGGGYLYPYVKRNQNISQEEIDMDWNFFKKELVNADHK